MLNSLFDTLPFTISYRQAENLHFAKPTTKRRLEKLERHSKKFFRRFNFSERRFV